VLDASGTVTPATGTIALTRAAGAASFTKTGGGHLAIDRFRNSLIVAQGTIGIVQYSPAWNSVSVQEGTLRLTTGTLSNTSGKINKISNLAVAPGAKLDLTNNALLIDYTGASPHDAIRDLIQSGYNAGAWNGAGINSSQADASDLHLGIADAARAGISGSFLGVPIDGSTLIIRFTKAGDADVNGIVNISDFARLALNFNLGPSPAQSWINGDFNYDDQINIADIALLAGNFNESLPSGVPRALPEPSAIVLFGSTLLLTFRRIACN
jgi:hypothetical protein